MAAEVACVAVTWPLSPAAPATGERAAGEVSVGAVAAAGVRACNVNMPGMPGTCTNMKFASMSRVSAGAAGTDVAALTAAGADADTAAALAAAGADAPMAAGADAPVAAGADADTAAGTASPLQSAVDADPPESCN
jgi:hypothetical protein